MSQKQNILDHLENFGSITPIDALNRFGCFRLAARVKDLRDEGVNITTLNEDGHARYVILVKESH